MGARAESSEEGNRDEASDDQGYGPLRGLSGGQTRRLGIAGVLVRDAAYLLLDEPAAGLDPREWERLVEILRPTEKDLAVLISTHDTDSLIDSDSHILVLAGGVTVGASRCVRSHRHRRRCVRCSRGTPRCTRSSPGCEQVRTQTMRAIRALRSRPDRMPRTARLQRPSRTRALNRVGEVQEPRCQRVLPLRR
ncbi:AAA family ATPase [Microbacterium arborescens]|uniref:AAA family ATPase n=1 Tax=Microbacterium arborescens TaxID=33883 RepID=UPI003C732136